jgi:hypothetical protein
MLGGTTRAALGAAAMLAVGLILAGPAGAASGGRVIEAQDACDPVTFGELCHRAGDSGPRMTFQEVFAELGARHEVGAWRFDRERTGIKAGETLVAKMGRGGEFHTFTEVPAFGPGCIPEINVVMFGAGRPADVCLEEAAPGVPAAFVTTGLLPGDALRMQLSRGTHRFQCLIHPWMRSTVTVE